MISIIVPCFNEEKSLVEFYKQFSIVRKEIRHQCFEIIFVDDGSQDKSLQIIKQITKQDPEAYYISFTRNFGKEAAILAGLKQAKGEYVAILDADLQDPPELLIKMYDLIQEGTYECIATRRVNREGEPKIRSFFAKLFYKLINKISDIEIMDGARDFRLMKREVVNSILQLGEYNRFSKGIFGWVGHRTKWIEYVNQERRAGESKWSFWGLFRYALEGVVAFSTVPLALSSLVGIALFIMSIIFIVVIVIKTIIFGDPVDGWPSLVCVIFFVSGIQLLCIGILGQYLAKTYMETKKRPIYIVREMSRDLEAKSMSNIKEYDDAGKVI